MSLHLHTEALAIIVTNILIRRGFLESIALNFSTEEIKETIEEITERARNFFVGPDDYSELHVFDERPGEEKSYPYELVYSLTYDKDEHDAAERAEQGDFFPIAKMLEERGYLRTERARMAVSDRLKGGQTRWRAENQDKSRYNAGSTLRYGI